MALKDDQHGLICRSSLVPSHGRSGVIFFSIYTRRYGRIVKRGFLWLLKFQKSCATISWFCLRSSYNFFIVHCTKSNVQGASLKTLDTIGNCQRPVFSLCVSHHYSFSNAVKTSESNGLVHEYVLEYLSDPMGDFLDAVGSRHHSPFLLLRSCAHMLSIARAPLARTVQKDCQKICL